MRRLTRAALGCVLPRYLIDELVGEVRISLRRARYSRPVRRALAPMKDCRVAIGCGDQPVSGWVNLDVSSVPGAYFWDCRRDLPFADNAVTSIFAEHVFEHFEVATDAQQFLRECLRCLRPGGVVRIVVPDAGAYLSSYQGPWEPLTKIRPLEKVDGGWKDRWMPAVYQTQMQLINAVFRQDWQHKYAYDEETLTHVLRQAGFSQVISQRFGVSVDRDLAKDQPARESESLYADAIK
jgi:predicted SAM-dependent methyltransferase